MSAVLDSQPVITTELATPATQVATLKSVALAHFSALEPGMRALAERYRAVAFDLTTPKGMEAAKKARQDLRENGRFAVQRAEKAIKDEANDLKRAIAPKVEALIAITQPVEDHVHAQIEARETQLAAEKAERDRLEAERCKKHTDRIASLSGMVERAAGKTAAELHAAIETLENSYSTHPDVFEEFADEATQTKARVIAALKAMHGRAEAEERQRAENERRAAELREQEQRLAAERAELERQRAALAETQRIEAERIRAAAEARMAPVYDRAMKRVGHDLPYEVYLRFAGDHGMKVPLESVDEYIAALNALQPAAAELPEARDSQQVLKAEPATADATARDVPATASPRVGAMGAGQAADAAPAAADPPTLKLGDINDWLGGPVTTSAAGLLLLGITHSGTDKAAKLYRNSDKARIRAALIAHVERLA